MYGESPFRMTALHRREQSGEQRLPGFPPSRRLRQPSGRCTGREQTAHPCGMRFWLRPWRVRIPCGNACFLCVDRESLHRTPEAVSAIRKGLKPLIGSSSGVTAINPGMSRQHFLSPRVKAPRTGGTVTLHRYPTVPAAPRRKKPQTSSRHGVPVPWQIGPSASPRNPVLAGCTDNV
jgi:hypothetical protein